MNPDIIKLDRIPLRNSIQIRALIAPILILSIFGGALFVSIWNFDNLFRDISYAFEQTNLKRTEVSAIKSEIISVQSELYRILNLSMQNLQKQQLIQERNKIIDRIKKLQSRIEHAQSHFLFSNDEHLILKKIDKTLNSYHLSADKASHAIISQLPIANLFMVGVEQNSFKLLLEIDLLLDLTSKVNLTTILKNAEEFKVIIIMAFVFTSILSLIIVLAAFTRITKAIINITLSMTSIATDEEVSLQPAIHRKDEIGQMARTLEVFRNNAIKLQETNKRLKDEIKFRKQADKKINLLSQVVEQSPVSVMITDTQANIQYVNAAFEKITGYNSKEVMGRNPKFLKSGKTQKLLYEKMWQAITNNQCWDGEIQNQKKGGELFWERAHVAAITEQSGKILHYIAIKEDISQQKQQEEKILYQAHYDTLTHLPNRFLTIDRLSHLVKEAQRNNDQVAVLFLDLDDFKKVNDTMGHETGDKLLIDTAARLNNVVRSGDTVGRLGGDEFIVLMGNINEPMAAASIAENIIEQFRNKAFSIDDREMILTVSLGIALYPRDGDNPSELLRNADSAMYHSKEAGRNTYSFYTTEMNLNVSRRLALEEQMHGALERNEFTVVYQPKVNMVTDKIMGAEALLRWHNPALGHISPDEFISIAEQTGLIVPLGEFVLNEALAMAAKFEKVSSDGFNIAVNISPSQFRDPNILPMIKKALQSTGVPSHSLELEITEGVLMSGHAYVDQALMEINELGISISMDDFGTGYSSLSYLRSYPFDVLKIDRSFIMDITKDPADRSLISASIAMAHGLGLKVVAEGVETKEQLEYLQQLDCDYGQGYLFSKPISAEKMESFLQS